MRILKRNLAFVLAMVMALSLTVSAKGIEDYTDANEIAFAEAVDVLTEMGILEGTDGVFNPTDILTREQGAKIIAYLMLGKSAADNLNVAEAPFTDVPANRWSAGYIAYCASQGIVKGVNANEFNPKGELTGTAFATMLLRACGYGVNGEFEGARWESEVNAQALKLGVFDGNLGVNFSAACTREEAALYAFNTLMDVYTVKYSELFGTYYAGSTVLDQETKNFMTLNDELYGYEPSYTVDEASDAFGRKGHVWLNAKNKVVTGLYASEADYVYTTGVKAKTLYADLGLSKAATATVVVNGWESADNNFAITKTGTNVLGGNGVLTEIYLGEDANGETTVYVVQIHTYLAKVTAVNAKKGTVTVNPLSATSNANVTFKTTEFAKDDLVLVTYALNEKGKFDIQSMELAETVEGTITARSANAYIKLDGEKMEYAADAVKANLNKAAFDENTVVVDNYGYAMDIAEMTAGKVVVDGYVKVTDSAVDTDKFDAATGAVVKAKFFADGATEVLNLYVEKRDLDNDSTTAKELAYKTIATDGKTVEWTKVNVDKVDDLEGIVYGYTMTEDGEIVLVKLNSADYIYKTNVAVAFDAKRVGKIDGAEVRVNADTVATVIESDDVDTFEGYTAIDFEAAKVEVLAIKNASGVIVEMYINGTVGNTEDDHVTIYYAGAAGDVEDIDNTTKLYTVTAADGETYTYVYEGTLTAKTAYNVKIGTTDVADADGKIAEVLNPEGHGEFVVETVADDNQAIKLVGIARTFHIAEDVTVWNVTDGVIADTMDAGDTIVVDADKEGTIVAIFIIKDAE